MSNASAKPTSRFNAYMALTMATIAMIVCFMAWSNFAPLAGQVATMFHLACLNGHCCWQPLSCLVLFYEFPWAFLVINTVAKRSISY